MVINEVVLLVIRYAVPLKNVEMSLATEGNDSSIECFRSGGEIGP